MRHLILAAALLSSACASYTTPGGPVRLDEFDRADIAELAARRPAASFPARLAMVRVQAADYRSKSAQSLVSGRFSVVSTQDLATDAHFAAVGAWPQVAGVAPLSRLLLPAKLESLDDLRLSAAKLQADLLIVYTVDTAFYVQGRGYGPLSVISLGLVPDRDARVTSTASAIFADVRTGFVHGVAESTASASGLTNAWSSGDTVDAKRLEAERQAFEGMMAEAGKTWAGIVSQQNTQVGVRGQRAE